MLVLLLSACAPPPFVVSGGVLNCPSISGEDFSTRGVVALDLDDGNGVLWLTPPPMEPGDVTKFSFADGEATVSASEYGPVLAVAILASVAWSVHYREACSEPPSAPLQPAADADRWYPVSGAAEWTSETLVWSRGDAPEGDSLYEIEGVASVSLAGLVFESVGDGARRELEDWTGPIIADGSYSIGDHGAAMCQTECWR